RVFGAGVRAQGERRLAPREALPRQFQAPMRGAVILFAATAALAEPGGWKTYSYPDAGFSAAFPAKPREAIQAHRSATLGRLESRVYLVEHGGAAYVVTAITLPAKARAETTASALLDDARDGFVAGVRGTLRRESELTLEGHPGRAIEASAAGQI